jgi:predicted alpha/beta hydrolase family esterase
MSAVARRVLIVPGLDDSGPEHWQTHWEAAFGYQRVVQDDWRRPSRPDWLSRLSAAVAQSSEPVLLVAHSLGCALVAHFAGVAIAAGRERVAGALLVAPADVDDPQHTPDCLRCFAPLPLAPLGFPATVVASRDDPFVSFPRAEHFAARWGARLVDAGALGHINSDSDLGVWSDGHRWLEQLAR